jgi:predicted nuclease with TOPRIM domain
MSGELENAMTSYRQIKAQLTSESGKVQEMMTANKELLAENSRLQEKAQNQSQNSLAELDELKVI